MSLILPLIFSLFFLSACGRHTQTASSQQGVSQNQSVRGETLSQDILNENISNLTLYVKEGGDLNAELLSGRTLLTEACHWTKFKVIEFLISHEASVQQLDRHGKSALQYAEENVRIKRSLFPELNTQLKRNLFLAAKSNQLQEIKKALEENPPVNFYLKADELGELIAGHEGETFLTFCIKSKLENVLRFLVQPKYELDVNMPNLLGVYPLTMSRELNLKNIEKLLLKLGAHE